MSISKHTPIFFLFCLIFITISCNDEINHEHNVEQATIITNEDKAIKAFNVFISNLNNSNLTRGQSIQKVTSVRKTSALSYAGEQIRKTRSLENDIPIYELKLDGEDSCGGFALVAETPIAFDVIAYTPSGSITDTVFNKGLALYFDDLINTVVAYNETIQTRADHWQVGWQDIFSEYVGDSEILEPYMSDEEIQQWINVHGRYGYYGPTDYCDIKSAFVPVKWGQESPYNNKVAFYTTNNVRANIGCFAVALGQIMAYHKKPDNYDWRTLTLSQSISASNATAANKVSQLLIDIATVGGTRFNSNGTASTDINRVVPTLREFGYDVEEVYKGSEGGSSSIIIEEIIKGRPVLYGAQSTKGGHIWVIDGVYTQERWSYGVGYVYGGNDPTHCNYVWRRRLRGRLVHCNWGWNGLSDGWYYNFIPVHKEGEVYFNQNKWIYLNIISNN